MSDIATPEKLIVKELANAVQKDMARKEFNIDELLTELREGSHKYETEKDFLDRYFINK